MAKEVKDAVVEEPVAVVEKPVKVVEEPVDAEGTEEELSPWYVFCSTGCGFCKKAEPVVEELNNEGYDILTLDLSEPDNQALNQELKTEYGVQCGTPWFINAETGKGVCGYREKGVLLKWLAGEDIPEPPRISGPLPKIPFYGSTDEENAKWTENYNNWLKSNEHMGEEWSKGQKSAGDILGQPRPKSDPPRPPMGQNMAEATDVALDKWGADMKVWQKENGHLPGLQDPAAIVQNFKNRRDQMAAQQAVGAPPAAGGAPPAVGAVNNAQLNTLDAKVQALEVKIDKIMNHFGVN